jgi:hypothetical protein
MPMVSSQDHGSSRQRGRHRIQSPHARHGRREAIAFLMPPMSFSRVRFLPL